MEDIEYELIGKIVPHHPHLKKLYSEHLKIEKELDHLEQYARYSPAAEVKHRELKKIKLRGKEKMMAIIGRYNS